MANLYIIFVNEMTIKIYEVLLRKHDFTIVVYITTLWNQNNNNKDSIVSHYIYLYQSDLDKLYMLFQEWGKWEGMKEQCTKIFLGLWIY